MVQKRPLGEEEVFGVSSKHPRHMEHSSQLVSVLEFPSEDVALQPHTSVGESENGSGKSKNETDEKLVIDNIIEFPMCTEKDTEMSVPVYNFNSSVASGSIREEYIRSDAPFHLLFSPDYYNPDRPLRASVHSEEIYSCFFENPPRKLVSIGPDYQAVIPEWGKQEVENNSKPTDASQAYETDPTGIINDERKLKLAGMCVIPMPDGEPSTYSDDKVGEGRTDCRCEDTGSVRCVRQHIMEAREKLGRTLGEERFFELGFSDMGEVVERKWSEEEEQLFHDIVFSNPASLGKKFWNHLSMAFPFRTKKEIVSYYFNVFMLRRRAVQNRCDPMNIDSDDDEWQVSDDSEDDEVGVIEEDGDSVIDSPGYQDDLVYDIHKDETHDYEEAVAHKNCDIRQNMNFGRNLDITNMSETYPRKFQNNSIYDPTVHPPRKFLSGEGGDHDVEDDSCISSENNGATQQVTEVKVDDNKHWTNNFNGMMTGGGGGGHEFVMEQCDTKAWDLGYLTCPKNDVDFLPTCSMIEEVFGAGAWNYKARDGKA